MLLRRHEAEKMQRAINMLDVARRTPPHIGTKDDLLDDALVLLKDLMSRDYVEARRKKVEPTST